MWWWLRSPTCADYYYFCIVSGTGYGIGNNAYYSAGVRPGFAV
ncbi:MAG: DUF6273 domain-containing protein [Flavonifractor plautii]